MIAGHHLVGAAYGWWLPNDPRGSWSEEIRVERIEDLGELHHGRKRVQPPGWVLREFYSQARDRLRHELLTFTPADTLIIAEAFRRVLEERQYTCYACAIMPDHLHCLIRRHTDHGQAMIEHFQEASRQALIEAGQRPVWHP